jgi:hypothetical protein
MKNSTKKNVLLTAAITLLLIMGTAIAPIQSYASEEHKKNGDLKSSIKSDNDENKKSPKQHMDQENICYRGDDCKEANQGQEIVGKDNAAKGFNDQSLNAEQAATPTTATPTETPTQPQTPLTCEECFTTHLNAEQLSSFGQGIGQVCAGGSNLNSFLIALSSIGVDSETAADLVRCLIAAGVTLEE